MILWLILAAVTLAAALWLMRPMTAAAPPVAAEEPARALAYRGVLEAVERDKAEALMAPEAAAAERAVIGRALIAASVPTAAPAPAAAAPTWLVLGLFLLLPLGGAALYLTTGLSEDGIPSAAVYSRQSELEGLAQRFAKRVADHPQDQDGYRLLGLAQMALGRYDEAARSYERVLAIGPRTSRDLTAHAELLARSSGKTGPEALAELDEALKLDPANSLARTARAGAREALGDFSGAREDWLYLQSIAPPGEWRDAFAARAEAAGRTAQRGVVPLGEGEDQAAFIEGMVARLAARLEADPNDLQGWLRLIHAYAVLGEREKMAAAAARARSLFGGDPKSAAAIEAAASK